MDSIRQKTIFQGFHFFSEILSLYLKLFVQFSEKLLKKKSGQISESTSASTSEAILGDFPDGITRDIKKKVVGSTVESLEEFFKKLRG